MHALMHAGKAAYSRSGLCILVILMFSINTLTLLVGIWFFFFKLILGERSWGSEDDTVPKNETSGFMGTHGGSGLALAHRPWGVNWETTHRGR